MRENRHPHQTQQNALQQAQSSKVAIVRPFFRSFNSAKPRKPQHADGSGSETETALHRTRLRNLDLKNFAKEILRKPYRQPAPLLGFCNLGTFAHCAKICSVLQNPRLCQMLTHWLTSCFQKDLFVLREDLH